MQLGHCAMQRPTDPTGSDAPSARVPDVRVGEWSMPWTARDGVGRLGPGIPKSDFWASAKGVDQAGWVCHRGESHDRVVRHGATEAEFTHYVKSTYRVLLTRTERMDRGLHRVAEVPTHYPEGEGRQQSRSLEQ